MCSPLAAVGFAVSAASQVMAYKAQQAQAKAEMDAYNQNLMEQKKAWLESTQMAAKSAGDQMAQENLRVQQEQELAVHKQLELRREALRIKGDVLASSTNRGISEEMVLLDAERQQSMYSDIVANNVRNIRQQSAMNKQGIVSEAQSRAHASMPRGRKQLTYATPGWGSVALGIVSSGLNAYSSYHVRPVSGDITTRPSVAY